jgi:hypothetical protein
MNMPRFTAEASLYKTNKEYFLQSLRSANSGGEAGVVYPALPICWRGLCACSGDVDCNVMFSSLCSSGGYARCWIRGPGDGNVFCLCT